MSENKKKVRVHADKDGYVVVRSKNNPIYAHIRVSEERIVIDDKGFGDFKTIYALIPGEYVKLKKYGWTEGQMVDGKIIVKEKLTPFNSKEPDRDLKIAGKTGVICMDGDKPIYSKNFYSLSESATDWLIEHSNGDEIRAAYDKLELNKNKEETSNSNTTATAEDIGGM